MGTDVPLRCRCGALQGVVHGVSPDRGNRLVCHCDDCQAFAHFLERGDDVLDANGGSDIFQTSPALVEFTDGTDRLACMRLRENGLLRWYAGCCNTPIANTLASRQVAFVGLPVAGLRLPSAAATDQTLGPVRERIFGRFAVGDRSALVAHDKSPPRLLLRLLGMLLRYRLRGDHKRSPFFDLGTGAPRAVPRVLTASERSALSSRDGDG